MRSDELPSAGTYHRAFEHIRSQLTLNQIAMLRYQLEKRRAVTANELAKHVGYSSYAAVNIQYGRVGTMLRDADPEIRKLPGQQSYAFAWFDKIPRIDGGYEEWVWSFHEQVVTALRKCAWLKPAGSRA